jgi:PAS domain S-box-containing protein
MKGGAMLESAATTTQLKRFLVLEQDPILYARLEDMLSHLGAVPVQATHAQTIEEGLSLLAQCQFDAALVDHASGENGGLPFVVQARALGFGGPIILLGDKNIPKLDLWSLRLGAADCLAKEGLSASTLERSLRYCMERHQVQDVLRRSEEYYRGIIDNSQDLITIVDEHAVIRFESRSVEAILGFEPQQRLGGDFFEFIHPADAIEVGKRLDLLVSGGAGTQVDQGECRMLHQNGSWRDMEYKAKNLLQLSGLRGILINARDVTERKRGIEGMLKVERLAFLGQMAAGMAHEVRNPLAIIQMSAEMLGEDPALSDEGLRQTTVIMEQCKRLLRLMNETLNFSKDRPCEAVQTEPRELLEHSLGLARMQFGPSFENIQLAWSISQGLGPLWTDRQKIELVLVNLVLNACQAMPGGGRLCLGAERQGEETLFFVEDSGPGVSREIAGRIFEPFFTTKHQGSGLGLWMCQRMVDSAGGRLELESTPGVGSKFKVWVPSRRTP